MLCLPCVLLLTIWMYYSQFFRCPVVITFISVLYAQTSVSCITNFRQGLLTMDFKRNKCTCFPLIPFMLHLKFLICYNVLEVPLLVIFVLSSNTYDISLGCLMYSFWAVSFLLLAMKQEETHIPKLPHPPAVNFC